MTKPTSVHHLGPSTDETYPRILFNHPRNRDIDWIQVEKYAEHGSPTDACAFDVFLNADGDIDAVWIGSSTGFLAYPRLRHLLQELAGDAVEFPPFVVNGQPHSIVCVVPVIDPLDLDRSQVRYDLRGEHIKMIDMAVWNAERLTDPLLFRIPQMRSPTWTTNTIRQAYEDSGYTGLSFRQSGTVA